VTYSRPAAKTTPSQLWSPCSAKRAGSDFKSPNTTNTPRITNSTVTTNNSDRPTSFEPTMLTNTTTTIKPMPMSLPDHVGVSHGSSARTYPANPAQYSAIAMIQPRN
jgi:hypothetical protein